ncbi:MAG: LamG-like jellyroll fold domain-containing protein, partial [Verrucomicrobiota bacterium]
MGSVSVTNGKTGSGLHFNGMDSFANIDGYRGIAGVQDRTVSLWVSTPSDAGAFVYWGAGSKGNRWTFRMHSGQGTNGGAIRIGVNNGHTIHDRDIRDNQWHHAAVTWATNVSSDITNAQLYVDGRLGQSIADRQTVNTTLDQDVRIGRSVNNWFDGRLDEVRISNVARSSNWLHSAWLNVASNDEFVCYGEVVHANPVFAQNIDHVIHITVGGLRSDAITTLGPAMAPNFHRLRVEGAFTDNARTDPDTTLTLPNHISIITGRGQEGVTGHNVTRESDPGLPGGVRITTNVGTFVRGSGALRIDDGDQANYLDVNASLITAPPGSNTITISGWFKFEDVGGNGSDTRNFIWETTAPRSLSFAVRTSAVDERKHTQWFFRSPSTAGVTTNLPIVDDLQWHHAVVVYDEVGDQLKFYFDGVLVDHPTFSDITLDSVTGFHIGSDRAGDGGRNWDGLIDDLAVFDHEVSSNQIAALHAGSLDVNAVTGGQLVAYWPFDTDYASTTNNGLYQGTPVTGSLHTVHLDSQAAGGDAYIASVFDRVHDSGFDTGLYAGSNALSYIHRSWNQ